MAWMLPLLPGDEVPAVKGGRVSVVEDDALWGGVVEIVDANGCTWRYCGLHPAVLWAAMRPPGM